MEEHRGVEQRRMTSEATSRFVFEVDMQNGRAESGTSVLHCPPETIAMALECAMQEARIELLQRMPIFGGIRAEIQAKRGARFLVDASSHHFFACRGKAQPHQLVLLPVHFATADRRYTRHP
jgi:hypothetical protein